MRSRSGGAADRVTADALDRYWDSLSSAHPGGPSRPAELLDPALTDTVRQLRVIDPAPRPEPAFATRLWAELMASQDSPAAASPPAAGVAGRLSALPRQRFLVEAAVAAALLIVVLGGGSALNLPAPLDPAAPTVAASAGVAGGAGMAAIAGCDQTATPEPTRAAVAAGAVPALPTLPAAATSAAGMAPC